MQALTCYALPTSQSGSLAQQSPIVFTTYLPATVLGAVVTLSLLAAYQVLGLLAASCVGPA